MDRFAAMVILLGLLVTMVLMVVSLFAIAPIVCSCLASLLYSLYLFIAYEEAGVHHAQEFENRFWTMFAILFATAIFFASDSPFGWFGLHHPVLACCTISVCGYLMHLWDRCWHRHVMLHSQSRHDHVVCFSANNNNHHGGEQPHHQQQARLMESFANNTNSNNTTDPSLSSSSSSLLHDASSSSSSSSPHQQHQVLTTMTSLEELNHRYGIPMQDYIQRINDCLNEIDQLLIPSTINNFINHRFVLQKEREIITVFQNVANWGQTQTQTQPQTQTQKSTSQSNLNLANDDDDGDDKDSNKDEQAVDEPPDLQDETTTTPRMQNSQQQPQQEQPQEMHHHYSSKEAATAALNYLVRHVKLGLCFYKIKDHRNFNGKHRTELCHLLAVERLDMLNVVSRVILLHSLQLLKLRANPQAEYWVRNIILQTHLDDLSNLKTLTDGKGDYFCMNKLIFEDIRSETTRQDILKHIRKEAALQLKQYQQQEQYQQQQQQLLQDSSSSPSPSSSLRRRRGFSSQNNSPQNRTQQHHFSNDTISSSVVVQQQVQHQPQPQQQQHQRRKVLSDVDDTLYCSGAMYPAGVDKRFARKTVYPGVLAFYRELDVGTRGPPEWRPDGTMVGNLVFLSARPHVYKDLSEKANYKKFEKLMKIKPSNSNSSSVSSGNNNNGTNSGNSNISGGVGGNSANKSSISSNPPVVVDDGRKGMHTMPSLLPGDLVSGSHYIITDDFEPLARKKFDNFRRYVSIYPEFRHVFVCDNGQGDVRAGEMMFDGFPYEFEALYVHVVIDKLDKTYGYAPKRWRQKHFQPFFFRTYPEAALHAATRSPPLIRVQGLQRICAEAVKDFMSIEQWPSEQAKSDRRLELNQAVWRANLFLSKMAQQQQDENGESAVDIAPVALIPAERKWANGQKVKTPYGSGVVVGFNAEMDLYNIDLDWRPLNVQGLEHEKDVAREKEQKKSTSISGNNNNKQDQRLSKSAKGGLETVPETDEGEDEIHQQQEVHKTDTVDNILVDVSKVGVKHVTDADADASSDQADKVTGATEASIDGVAAATSASSNLAAAAAIDGNEVASLDAVDVVTQTVGEPSAERSEEFKPQPSVKPGCAPDSTTATTPTLPSANISVESSLTTASSATEKCSSNTVPSATLVENSPVADSTAKVEAGDGNIIETKDIEDSSKTRFRVHASVSGRFVTKYTPPVLPKALDKQQSGGSIFTFLSPPVAEKKPPFKVGDQFNSPYGPVKVLEYRAKQGLVVVSMLGWKATGYLSETTLKPIPKSLLASFISRMTTTTSSTTTSEVPHRPNHPFAEGTKIVTPFGRGTLTRPVLAPPKSVPSSQLVSSEATKRSPTATNTVAIRLDSWKLANGANPMLYCTPETAKSWKERKAEEGASFFSALETLVTSSRTLLEPFLIQQQKKIHAVAAVKPPMCFERYYQDAAAVTTPYGDGVVRSFRTSDGFYEVDLIRWTLENGKHPKAFIRKDDLSCRIAPGCQEGYPVLTNLGVSGRLASVEAKTGIHIVTIPSAGMLCYLQPESIVRPLKGAVGEDVSTAYGEGRILRYDKDKDVYCIKLNGWDALLYAKGDTFELVGDGVQDRDGSFGVNWLLRFLFSSATSGNDVSKSTRSRSDSVSGASQSNRSVSGTRSRSNSIVSGN